MQKFVFYNGEFTAFIAGNSIQNAFAKLNTEFSNIPLEYMKRGYKLYHYCLGNIDKEFMPSLDFMPKSIKDLTTDELLAELTEKDK